MRTTTVLTGAAAGLATVTAAAALLGNVLLRRRLRSARTALAGARHDATHDVLTGLLNRAGAEGHLRVCAASGELVAVLLVDLDDFKPVNDTHGHAAGDVVLAEVARRLRTLDSTVAARLGGDEFLLIADSLDGEDADERAAGLAAAVVDAVRRPIEVRAGVRIRVSASVGWAWLDAGDDAGDVLHSADTALYRAKAAGGNTTVAWGVRPLRAVAETRPLVRTRDSHPHRVPSEIGVVIAR